MLAAGRADSLLQGGNSNDKELAVTISDDGQSATWLCFRGSCGFTGGVTVGENSKQQPASKIAGRAATLKGPAWL